MADLLTCTTTLSLTSNPILCNVLVQMTPNSAPETIAVRGGLAEVNARGLTLLAEHAD